MSEVVEILRGDAPLVLSIPHTGTRIESAIEADLISPWLARKDADWMIEKLYDFAAALDATVVRATVSRTVIDVNRDPSGASLYPGRPATALCPTETFDGEPLYQAGREPDAPEIERRRSLYFEPYHAALATELARLCERHRHVVIYDCHSIRSVIPRLFDGELPHMNVGTHDGASCAPELQERIEAICADSMFSWVANGRFTGGWITRSHGRPEAGVHAVQMELACRAYLEEPIPHVGETSWPPRYSPRVAAPMRTVLKQVLEACLASAAAGPGSEMR